MKKLIFSALVALLSTPGLASAATSPKEVTERAQDYNRFFFPSGTPARYLDAKITPGVSRTRELRAVLPGVLYRGGGPGGQRPLPAESLKALCEAGFSLAVYAYELNWQPVAPIECVSKVTGKRNTLRYISGNVLSQDFKRSYLNKVRDVALNPDLGPVFVHCWNGYHASGELAAIALRQICGWSGDNASAYWQRHSGGFPMISRIRKFTPVSSLEIPSEIQDSLCRQGN